MKTKDVIVYSLIFLACVGLAAEVVVLQLTGKHIFANETATQRDTIAVACTDERPKQRQATDDPQLKAVAEYERVCNSAFFDDMMLFTNMPISEENS
jgi:hypothetical protein